jgi:chemosensory pili system protein ChpA (sensor histidine kinase/response regulator)
MDVELQVQLNFLEEAEDHIDRIESAVINLSTTGADPHLLNLALRSAHSIKGGAATMRLTEMSQVAHRLEDFLKILRVRPDTQEINLELESLLLQGVDGLRQLSQLYRREVPVDVTWIHREMDPIFEQLRDYLGELRAEDENTLLADDEGMDPGLLIFEEGVETVLEDFSNLLPTLSGEALQAEFLVVSEQLVEFGQMANLDPFTKISKSIRHELSTSSLDQVLPLAQRALRVWERAHAMVQLRQFDALETLAQGFELPETESSTAVTELIWDEAEGFSSLGEMDPNNFSLNDLNPSDWGDLEAVDDPLGNIDLNFDDLNLAELPLEASDPFPDATVLDEDLPSELMFLSEDYTLPDPDFDIKESSDLDNSNQQLDPFEIEESLLENAEEGLLNLDGDPFEIEESFPAESEQNFTDLVDSIFSAEPQALLDLNPTETQDAFAYFDQASASEFPDFGSLDDATLDLDLSEVREAFAQLEPQTLTDEIQDLDIFNSPVSSLTEAFEPDPVNSDSVRVTTEVIPNPEKTSSPTEFEQSTVKVSVKHLQQFNILFGKLIRERNSLNLRLEQVLKFTELMRERMDQLEKSNVQLRKWYDRGALEGILPIYQAHPNVIPQHSTPTSSLSTPSSALRSYDQLDALEMDSYSELHYLSQEQMETIVQLQEVSTDIQLGLREVTQVTADINQTTRALQQNITRTQMRPFGEALKRFPRMIHDLSRQFDKPVHLKIEGEGTLLDRAILEALNDPLIHLIRNAFDHGIEDRASRVAAGKSEKGTIVLAASHRGNQIVITVKDDGRGINISKVRERAYALNSPLQDRPDKELLQVIFEPGFSTASQVTELSGRGIGLDIVRSCIMALRGSIHIDTQPGQGTTFTITVPFSLSVLRIMLLETAGLFFAVPASSIKEVIRLDLNLLLQDPDHLLWRNTSIPLMRLEEKLTLPRINKSFGLQGTPKIDCPTAVVAQGYESLGGLYIQRIWGEQEVAVTPIHSPIPLPPGFAGSTILGDGRVVPLVDPITLLQSLSSQSTQPVAPTSDPDSELSEQATVLVVEDSVVVRRLLASRLENCGYKVEQAKDGQEALDLLLEGLTVDAVITDIEMPRLDGFGLLSELRSQSSFERLPVMMLTSRSGDKHQKIAKKLGVSAYLAKPFNEQVLLQKLEELLKNKILK